MGYDGNRSKPARRNGVKMYINKRPTFENIRTYGVAHIISKDFLTMVLKGC